ncbi:MAG: capsid protein [CRESS virus sp. ctmn412]|nr:MAG: capsid protein [CRESS virus sp. ctmn412]
MSAYRGRRKRKFGYRKKSYRRNAEDKRIARIAKAVTSKAKELKYYDTIITNNTPVSGTSLVSILDDMAQGDTESTRDGNYIIIKSINVKGYVYDQGAGPRDTICRMILIREKVDCEGNLPLVGDLLDTDAIPSLRYWPNMGNFQVWWDKTFVIRASDDYVTDQIQHSRLVKYYKKAKKPIRAYYDGVGPGVGTCKRGHFFLITMTDQVAGNRPNWDLKVRITFTE